MLKKPHKNSALAKIVEKFAKDNSLELSNLWKDLLVKGYCIIDNKKFKI